MEDWVEKTFWAKTDDGYQAIVADDVSQTILDLAQGSVKAIRAREFSGCCECSHIHICMNSVWGDGLRLGGPDFATDGYLSTVHTCFSCDHKVLTDYTDDTSQRVVPENCPRWNSHVSSVIDCNHCRDQKRVLKTMQPSSSEHLVTAQWICGRLVNDVESRFSWRPDQLSVWLKRFQVALERQQDADGVVYDFVLLFNDEPLSCQHWAQLSVARRRFVKRIWVGQVRAVQDDGC